MFIGHFAVGIAGRRATPAVPLAMWFVAVQLLDTIWPVLVLAGVEHVRIDPGNTPFTPLDFYDYPWSHSLVGAVVWGVLLAAGWAVITKRGGALWIFGGVVSHWVLDVISHRPDVPVLPHGPYLGLGLWYSVPLTIAVETAMFAAAIYYYARGTRPRPAFWVLVGVLYVSYLASIFGPPPPSVAAIAWTGILAWVVILPLAWWADRGAMPRRTR